ncbi:unnamed protein product [Orchesella dallaii]|uniref:TFIIE beta domain-containing protein n=1 Tax=Orchesella dallaii TaxID=48710 RepID=A0ABP1PNI3_9HEXA
MRRMGQPPSMKSQPLLGGSNNGLVKWALSQSRSRNLQLATGGRYKYFMLSKIIEYLKTQFLECRDCRFTLEELLGLTYESDVSDEIKQWLENDAFENSSRIRKCSNGKYTYQPPLTCKSEKTLLMILKLRHQNGVGGLLYSLVEDSMPLAHRFVSNLVDAKKILQITRNDKAQVLFYKNQEPELDALDMDARVVDLWRKVDVANKEMSHIKMYLKKQHLKVFDDEAIDKRDLPPDMERQGQSTMSRRGRKRKIQPNPMPIPKRPRRVRKLRDNAHVEDQIDLNLTAFGEETHFPR